MLLLKHGQPLLFIFIQYRSCSCAMPRFGMWGVPMPGPESWGPGWPEECQKLNFWGRFAPLYTSSFFTFQKLQPLFLRSFALSGWEWEQVRCSFLASSLLLVSLLLLLCNLIHVNWVLTAGPAVCTTSSIGLVAWVTVEAHHGLSLEPTQA